MKRSIELLLFFAISLLLTNQLYAQNGENTNKLASQPLLFREVSGIITDTVDKSMVGVTVMLTSKRDTLKTSTNEDGVFVFHKVKTATFIITVSGVSIIPQSYKYLQNDAVRKIILDPIKLGTKPLSLPEVKVNGTPSIIYKTDTIEYRASDYVVRDNGAVDELLKKMEGFEVGKDGSVSHLGQEITKAKLNGKVYAGGDIAQAIQNLPSNIVDRIQVVDDYGDQAARTGIRDGAPKKILNITTRADKSIGIINNQSGQYGSRDRYNANVFVQHLNANQEIGIIGNLQNTVSSNTVGGTSKMLTPAFNYRDQWGKLLQVTLGYKYRLNRNNVINESYGQNFSSLGTNNFTDRSTRENTDIGHTFNLEMEFNLDSANYLLFTPTVNLAQTSGTSNSQNLSVGWLNQNIKGSNRRSTSAPNFGAILFYQHIFKKPKRNLSFQVSINEAHNDSNNETNNHTIYYTDSTTTGIAGDSTRNYLLNRRNKSTTYRGSLTYVEPLAQKSQIELNSQIRYTNYDNKAMSDTGQVDGGVTELTARDNIYNYSFTEIRLTLNYRFNGTKYNFSLGTTLVPSRLSGTNEDINNPIVITRSNFRILPVLRFSYLWSSTERFTLNYTGTNTEPNFMQMQPFVDRLNPQNLFIGNPNLQPTFIHAINAQFYNYIANAKLNYSLGITTSLTDNLVSVNNIQIQQPLGFITETHYVNLSGAHSISGRYNISKQFNDRKYNLQLNGTVSYNYNPSMSDNVKYFSTIWHYDERFGPRINPTDAIEINPYLGYDVVKSSFNFPGQNSSLVKTTSLAVDGKNYFFETYLFTYNISKKVITGLTGINTNPLIINAGLEKKFLKKKNLILTFNVYDLLRQNNFVQQNIGTQSITNVQSNALSRFFLFGIRLDLQKWNGTPTYHGKPMKRKGDGSFMQN